MIKNVSINYIIKNVLIKIQRHHGCLPISVDVRFQKENQKQCALEGSEKRQVNSFPSNCNRKTVTMALRDTKTAKRVCVVGSGNW